MELVSVIVPVYNVEKYLDKCIQSIQRQTYENLEIILVDDGSPDRCGKICDEYAREDRRISVLHKKNGGLSDARNAGVDIASGKYLLFVDSDDFIDEDLIRQTTESAEKYQSDIVLFDFKRLEPDGTVEICSMNKIPTDQGVRVADYPKVIVDSVSACDKFFRREFFVNSRIRFPLGYHYEDLGSIPKYMLAAKTISYVKEPFYNYVIREGSIITGTGVEKNYHDRCRMIEGVLGYYRENGAEQQYFRELEYLTLFHGYFIPTREILFRKGDRRYIEKFRMFLKQRYPDYRRNAYLKDMSGKEKIQFYMIDHRQYWMVQLLSKGRQLLSR